MFDRGGYFFTKFISVEIVHVHSGKNATWHCLLDFLGKSSSRKKTFIFYKKNLLVDKKIIHMRDVTFYILQ